MQYLAKWRVHVAARQLTELSVSVAEAAAGVGYASESAFYRAFRREFGMSPASWRRRTGEPGPAAFRQGR
jgi:AraC-like DNA-binding protein